MHMHVLKLVIWYLVNPKSESAKATHYFGLEI